jgi:hypothetical protein
MLVLIDESGCTGFKQSSSRYLVISMVIFDNAQQAENASRQIEELRIKLKVTPEFKFSSSREFVRDKFFEMAAKLDFKVYTLIAEKRLIKSHELRTSPKKFYNYMLKMMLKNDNGLVIDANIKIDGSGSREFKKASESYLRKEILPGKINKISFKDSKKDNLVQLADMIAGCIAFPLNSNSPKQDLYKWKRAIKGKIVKEWPFK